jgi:nucleoporin p58/p45
MQDFVDASTSTHNDQLFMKDLKVKTEQAIQDTIIATRIIEGFRAPQGGAGGGYLKDHASFPLEFFTRVTENMKHRLGWYKSTIEVLAAYCFLPPSVPDPLPHQQIERKLSSAGHNQTPQGK